MAWTKPNDTTLLIYGMSAGAVALGGGVIWLKATLFPAQITPCTQRYQAAVTFPPAGSRSEPASIRDLQSKLDFTEWGLIENVSLHKRDEAAAKATLEVRMQEGSLERQEPSKPKGGVGFRWAPGIPGGAEQACLAYDVYLPPDFEFNQGGKLPGLYGGPAGGGSAAGETSLSAQFMWRADGAGEIFAKIPNASNGVSIDRGSWQFPRGRWVHLEQEVVLNTGPGEADGRLLVWIDGNLRLKRDDLEFRQQANERLSGVLAEVYYAGKSASAAAPSNTFLRLSSFDLRWQ